MPASIVGSGSAVWQSCYWGKGFFAGLAVWGLITNGQLSTRGWIYIICFLVMIPAGIRIFRRGRPRPGKDGPPN